MSAYSRGYSINHIVIRLIENWRHALENNLFTGAVLMDLSKAFDCQLYFHRLLIAKLHTNIISFGASCTFSSVRRAHYACQFPPSQWVTGSFITEDISM